jgi:hypothetical protein
MPAPTLIAGPYHTPMLERGVELEGVVLGKKYAQAGDHPVLGITDAPIPWPWTRVSGTMRQLIVTPELERAIRTESVSAIIHWWGVGRTWVEQARKHFGVERMNPGTSRLWSELTASRLGESISYVGGAKGQRKIDQPTADKIRKRIAKGERRAVLAEEYGVTRQYLSMLVKGQRRPVR